MFIRQIESTSKILKQKSYFNFFHNIDYVKDLRKCDNCFEGFISDESELLYCEGCNSFIHRHCYSLSEDQYELVNTNETEDEFNFTFIKCESCIEREKDPQTQIECFLCNRNVGIMKCFFFDQRRVTYASKKNEKDSLYEYAISKTAVVMPSEAEIQNNNNITKVFAHTLCINSCSCLFIHLYKLLLIWNEEEYLQKKQLGNTHKCALCNQGQGLLIQCEHSKKKFATCKEYYHPFCAAEKKMIYFQQGMRLIHQNQKLKYNQLNASEIDDTQTYYYVICRNHINEMFQQKVNSGFFQDKQAIYSNLKMTQANEKKNFDDWFEQMISEYDISASKIHSKDKNGKKKSIESIDTSLNSSYIKQQHHNNETSLNSSLLKQPIINLHEKLDQYIFNKKQNSHERDQTKQSSNEGYIKISSNDLPIENVKIKEQSKQSSIEIINSIFEQPVYQPQIQEEQMKKQVTITKQISNEIPNTPSTDIKQLPTPKQQTTPSTDIKQLPTPKQQTTSKQQITKIVTNNSQPYQKWSLVEKILSLSNLNIIKDFESKIIQKKQISSELYGQAIPIIKSSESEKQKYQKIKSNTLKRELGIDLPPQLKLKKKQIQSDNKESQEDDEGDKYNNNNNNDKEDHDDSDEDYQEESETRKQEQSTIRRSGRSKKTPNALNETIYTIYEQKKNALKQKDSSGKENSKDSSSGKKLTEQQQHSMSSKKEEKNKNNKVDSKAKKSTISKKKKGRSYLENNSDNDYDEKVYNSDSSDIQSDKYLGRKVSKKLKQSEETFLINPEDHCKRQILFQDVYNTSSDEEQMTEKKTTKNKQNEKIRNFRNLDEKDDDVTDDENTFNIEDDSFLRILNQQGVEQEEISEIGYVVDKLQGLEGNAQEQQTYNSDEDDDNPLDLPDLNDFFENDQQDNRLISQIDGNIGIIEAKIMFLKEDSKLKKHSFLDETNYEQFHKQELKRLQNRRIMLEQQIEDKKKIKIENYRQSLLYFSQQIDNNCLTQKSARKVLINNVDDKIPAFRLIKYRNQQKSIGMQKVINLCFTSYENTDPQQYDIIGFSSCQKVCQQLPSQESRFIHNFFNLHS